MTKTPENTPVSSGDNSGKRVSDADLEILICGLSDYKKQGVIDPWLLDDGTTIEPLDVLVELQELRKRTDADE